MKAILAVNNLGFIGLNGGLPWKCKADFKHFKEMTWGGNLLAGWKTYYSLPRLEGRNIILANMDLTLDGIDWCIGGKRTYEFYCNLFTELHISHINNNTIGDVMFPDFRNLNPNCKIFNYRFDVD
jgi:dihydrofolate reductase